MPIFDISNIIDRDVIKFDLLEEEYFISLVKNRYPFYGTQIGYRNLVGSIFFEFENDFNKKKVINFFEEIIERQEISEDIYFLGDSATDKVLHCAVKDFSKVLDALLNIPQHYYIMPHGGDWIMIFTLSMAAFGYAQKPAGRA